jgi:ArsR family transcriptional regulator
MKPDVLFRALADDTRLRCLMLIVRQGELCVCELTYALKLMQPKISRHLATLRATGVVVDRREGLWVHYRLAPGLPSWVRNLLDTTADALVSQAPYATDAETLKKMPNRPGVDICEFAPQP